MISVEGGVYRMEEFKEKIQAALNLKYEHIEDIISVTKKHRDEHIQNLEERKRESKSEKGNLYLEGIIDGMDSVIKGLEAYVRNDEK